MVNKRNTQAPKPPPVAMPDHRRSSRDVIYEAMMRGGTAFGAPFREGVASLTERVVARFKQRGFFGFETSDPEERPNKFTRYGAARYRGPYRKPTR